MKSDFFKKHTTIEAVTPKRPCLRWPAGISNDHLHFSRRELESPFRGRPAGVHATPTHRAGVPCPPRRSAGRLDSVHQQPQPWPRPAPRAHANIIHQPALLHARSKGVRFFASRLLMCGPSHRTQQEVSVLNKSLSVPSHQGCLGGNLELRICGDGS